MTLSASQDDTAVLQAVDVSRRFGRRWAVRRVHASFAAGSVTALVGPNGAGKSTFIKICGGLLRPSEGTITCFGERVHGFASRAVRRRLGFLAHETFVIPTLTGRENLAFYRDLYGSTVNLDEILSSVGLALAADRPAQTYSRGMVQRLALGRLFVQEARLWLLDEPTTGLDVEGRALLAAALTRAKANNIAIVAVTHHVAALGEAVDGVLTLDAGRRVNAR